MDDVWSKVECENVKSAFPDDCNRSRILFTSHLLDMALQDEFYSNPHFLHFLLNDESGELCRKGWFFEEAVPWNTQKVVSWNTLKLESK